MFMPLPQFSSEAGENSISFNIIFQHELSFLYPVLTFACLYILQYVVRISYFLLGEKVSFYRLYLFYFLRETSFIFHSELPVQ